MVRTGDTVQTTREIFEDGAVRTGDMVLHEPPSDPYLRQRVIVDYHTIRATAARNKFEHKKKDLHTRAQQVEVPAPPQCEIDALQELCDQARACIATLQEAVKELERLEPQSEVGQKDIRRQRMQQVLAESKAVASTRISNMQI